MKKFIIAALVALPMSVFAQKFGHYNSEQVVQAMPEYAAAQTELQNLQKTYEDEFKRMQDELQTKAEAFEKEKATLPESIAQRREQELQDLYTRTQQYAQTSQQDLQKVSQQKMGEISVKVQNAIKEVGAAGGFVYIMDVVSGIPYISETLSTDVTAQIKAKLGLK